MEHGHFGSERLDGGTDAAADSAYGYPYMPGDLSQAGAAPVEAGSGESAEAHGSGKYPSKVLSAMVVGGEAKIISTNP